MNHKNSLFDNLISYSRSDYYPFHMPGHKRAALDFPNPWSIDITEIEGFDNLHHAEGILEELQQETSKLFGAQKSFCLVNGSTCGLLSAVSACVKPGGKLLMSRNCHKSVYHGVYLRNITPVYLMPEITEFGIMGSLSPQAVAEALQQQPDIQAVLVVSPTYDGVVSDIVEIARIAHSHGIPLIVDEAHGAHFPLSQHFPASALTCGADVVIQSLHKTLPAFTQTALLHLNSSLVEEAAIRRFLGIYQSSSPSYLLMASMDRCIKIIQENGNVLFDSFHQNLQGFYEKCSQLQHIQVFQGQKTHAPGFFDWDNSKILISGASLGLSGQKLHDILLEKYHIQLEMASGHYALALASLMDTPEGFVRLFDALLEIDQTSCSISDSADSSNSNDSSLMHGLSAADIISIKELYRIPVQRLTISEALEQPAAAIPLEDSAGAVSQEYIYLYPPGIPLVAPGEIIDTQLLETIARIKKTGLSLEGLSDMTNQRINVVIF